MLKKTLICILSINILLLCDTSAFSVLSLGDIETSLNGSTGIAYSDSLVIRNHNFATWTSVANTSFSISASYYSHEIKTADGAGSNFDRFTFEDLSFALPFGDRNIFGFAYYPISVVDITSVTESDTVLESFESTELSTLEVKKGSLSNASFIYGKGFDNLSFSLSPSFKFGNYETTKRYKYSIVTPSYPSDLSFDKYFEKKSVTQLFHFVIGGGFLYRSPLGVDIGGVFSLPVSSYANRIEKFERTTSYGTVIQSISNTETRLEDVEWPVEFGAGISYKINKIIMSFDSSAKLFDGKFSGIDDSEMINYTKNTFGLSFDPRHKRYDPYYQRMVYSGYFTVEKRPYEFPDGEPVYDMTGMIGINFPFNGDRTNIELKAGYTRSGSKDNNGIENDTFRLHFNFIGSDRWKLKKEKYND